MSINRDAIFDDAQASPIFIDGERASLGGRKSDYPVVRRAGGKGGDVEFSWDAVSRILASHRQFRS